MASQDIEQRREEDASSTLAQMGSEIDEEEEDSKGGKRICKEAAPAASHAKKGKVEAEDQSYDKLFVRNLPAEVDEEAVKNFFKLQGVDVESVEFVVGRSMGLVHLAKEMSSSEVEKINGMVWDGNPLMADLFERDLKVPEADKARKGVVEGTEAKTKDAKVTSQRKSVDLLSKDVETYLSKVLDFASALDRQPEISYDLGLGINQGVILVDDKEDKDFGKKVEKRIKGHNITVISEKTEKLDGAGVDNIYREAIKLNQPCMVLLKNVEAAGGEVLEAITSNIRSACASHLPIITVGTTTLPDQVENGLVVCCNLRP